MTTKTTTITLFAALCAFGCVPPGPPSLDDDTGTETAGDGDGDSTSEGTGDGDGDSQPADPGEAWGPCPTDMNGTPTLCQSEDLACVPADFSEANICLPLNGCPSPAPTFSTGFEIGWGGACYPRCNVDLDCLPGMVCAMSVADSTPMCAWPVDLGWCCVSPAPDEICYGAEAPGVCDDGTWCPSGPNGLQDCDW